MDSRTSPDQLVTTSSRDNWSSWIERTSNSDVIKPEACKHTLQASTLAFLIESQAAHSVQSVDELPASYPHSRHFHIRG